MIRFLKFQILLPQVRHLSLKQQQLELFNEKILDYRIEDFLLDDEWRSELKDEFDKKYFKNINYIVSKGYQENILNPEPQLVFNAFNLTELKKIKVVIIGQDPYHVYYLLKLRGKLVFYIISSLFTSLGTSLIEFQ